MNKDKEWLKEEIGELPCDDTVFNSCDSSYIDSAVPVMAVYDLIDQLDEPEVLSQEWISENVEYAYFDMLDGSGRLSSATAIIKPKKLQNILVPKQEGITHKKVEKYLLDRNIRVIDIDIYEEMQSDLAEFEKKVVIEKPVIPKFVADFIEETKPYNSLRVAFKYIAQQKKENYDDELAFWNADGNSELFARAWLDGYEVEKEKLYYVLDKEGATLLKKSAVSEGVAKSIGTNIYSVKNWKDEEKYQLTEQEIKDYDERFLTFAVKVEELEE